MRDIVREILQAEKRVEELLQQAREKASNITAQAEKEANRKVAEARDRAQEIVRQTVQRTRREVEEIRKSTIEEAERKSRDSTSRSGLHLDDLADQVARMVMQTDIE